MRLVVEDVWTWIYGHYQRGLLDPVTSYLVDGSWFSDAYKKGRWDGRRRLVQYHLSRRQYYFPTGLLEDVARHLTQIGHPYEIDEQRQSRPEIEPCYELTDNKCGKIRLDEGPFAYQADAVDEGLIRGRGVFQCATGSGKTEIAAGLLKSLDMKSVWFTHRRPLLYQTQRRLQERLGQPIGLIGDGHVDYQKVTVAMVQTCSFREHDKFLRDCQVVIGDEVHHIESKTWYENFAAVRAPWRFGLTATPRLEKEGLYLLSMTGRIIFRMPAQQLIDRGVLVPPRIWIHQMDLPKFHPKDTWTKIYKLGIVENDERNRLIGSIARQFADEGKPVLILVHRINHAEILKTCLLAVGGLESHIIKGSVSQIRRDAILADLWDKKIPAVVAIASTVGEGCDFPELKAIINATGTRGGGNAAEGETGRATIQILGRGLRCYPGKSYVDYVDFADQGHRTLRKASLARLGTLKEQGYGSAIKYWSSYVPEPAACPSSAKLSV